MELRLSERHIVALNFLLVAILAYVAALAVNDFIALRLAPAPPIPVHAASRISAAGAHPRAYYDAIVKRDVFNLVPQQSAAPVVVEDLHLNLIGVSVFSDGRSFAIIADRGGQQSVYRLGQS